MSETNDQGQSANARCAGGEPCGCAADDAGGRCVCDSTPTRRSRVKTLIAAVVLLAAIGVGAYSLVRIAGGALMIAVGFYLVSGA